MALDVVLKREGRWHSPSWRYKVYFMSTSGYTNNSGQAVHNLLAPSSHGNRARTLPR